MSSVFPLVRAADITPFVRWIQQHGRPIGDVLDSVCLSVAPWEAPDQPVTLLGCLEVMRTMALHEGPDIACRVVSDSAIAELGELGRLMLETRTPRQAISQLCALITMHSTHELFVIVPTSGGIYLREQMMLELDQTTLHIVHQYVAALARSLCNMTGVVGEPLGSIQLTPHPEIGLAHLRGTLGCDPAASASGVLSIFISDDVLDRPFKIEKCEDGIVKLPEEWKNLSGERRFDVAAQLIIDAMLDDDGAPSVERFAALSGLSLRTVQRRLAAEGTSYSQLLEKVRRQRALVDLSGTSKSIGAIATELGYSAHSAFVRAMRRWEGVPPKQLRKQQI